jgi:predicted DNA-binding transcriptional regulator YafY
VRAQLGVESDHVEDAPKHGEGAVVVRLAVTNRDAFRSFVLGLLDHAEVLGPPELRAEVAGWLDATIGAYDVPVAQPGGPGRGAPS